MKGSGKIESMTGRRKHEMEDPVPPETKKRVPSYVLRKEEAAELHAQVETLEAQLIVLQRRLGALGTASALAVDERLERAKGENARIKCALYRQQLALAGTQSMMAQCLEHQFRHPLCAYLHLPARREERREAILSMKDEQFARVYDYLEARGRYLDLSKPHFSEHRFESADGATCCVRYEVIQFEGVRSLKQVFDALLYYLFNMEISISETLGDITVRDDYDIVDSDAKMSNHRLISKDQAGVTIEFNAVAFGQFFPRDETTGREPYAIGATISVDEDELHPYKPQERIRKDINAGIMLTELGPPSDDGTVVVVLQRSGFIKHARQQFPLSSETVKELQDGMTRWADVMLHVMRGILYKS